MSASAAALPASDLPAEKDVVAAVSAEEAEPVPFDQRELRMSLPFLYPIVGFYRLLTDPALYVPVWKKTKHGTLRGLVVGGAWVALAARPTLAIVRRFGQYIPAVKRYSGEHVVLGFNISVAVWATTFILSAQFWWVLRAALSKNMRIAKSRAWTQTLESRGKPASFWGPYVEEWQSPPIDKAQRTKKRLQWTRYALGWAGRFVLNKFILFPLNFVPVVGILISSVVKALGTARILHQPYFEMKGMSEDQIDVFFEERKLDYLAFGFTSALLEALPFVGLLFSVSNRVGAAAWSIDLEKRQGAFRSGALKPLPRGQTSIDLVPGAEHIGLDGLGRVDIKSDAIREHVDVGDIVGGWREKKDL